MSMWDAITGTRPKRIGFVLVVGGAISTALLVFFLLFSVELSGLATGAWLSFLAFGLWALLDWSIKEIDTIAALQHRFEKVDGQTREKPPNVAWALVLAGFLVMLGLAMLAGHS